MLPIDEHIQLIMTCAVLLNRNKQLPSTIYCLRQSVFVLNTDHTVLIHFPLHEPFPHFEQPLSFLTEDYDSHNFRMKNGKIHFIKKHCEYARITLCRVPDFKPAYINQLFHQYLRYTSPTNSVVLSKGIRSCIDKELSHIEFREREQHLHLIQRNIYSGKLITIYPRPRRLFDPKIASFQKFGLRTNDFWALFGFLVPLKFYVNDAQLLLVESINPQLPFTALLTKCVYDTKAFTGVFYGQ